MRQLFIYKKWNWLLFLNNTIQMGFFTYTKKFISLRFDTNNFFFWIYKKKVKFQNIKLITLKKRFKFV